MLTADLVQARIRKGEVRPRYVNVEDPDKLALAEDLISIFACHQGRPRHELDQELQDRMGTGTDFLFHRALAKLLFDRSTFDTEGETDPEELRRTVFEAAAAAYRIPHRDGDPLPFRFDPAAVMAAAAAALDISPQELERGLYADLKDEQILVEWKPCRPRWLLERYNVALAQGVLLRATELTLEIGKQPVKRQRELLRKIKFFQLMHRVRSDGKGGYVIHLDGPVSLFKASGKYGVKMASFFPTLLHFERWKLEASVRWGARRQQRTFRASSRQRLKPYTRLLGQWQPEEIAWLPKRFRKLETEWQISTDAKLVQLGGQGVLVPDFVFLHPPSGKKVFMEVLGFWRRGAVESRLELLRRHGPENVILALSKQLAAGRDDLGDLAAEVFVFRTAPIARKVLAVLEERFCA